MQKISKTLAIMGLMTPLSASALGTGEIKLYSALNQKLNAEVALVTSAGESLEDLRVNLAPAEAFAKAGIERPYFLTGLRFEIVSKGRPVPAIKITSSETMREPFVSFLVELQWSQGHVLREFTLLLDPPSLFKERKTAARSLARTESAVPASAPAPAPAAEPTSAESFSGASYGPVRPGQTLWSIAKVAAAEQGVTIEQMVAALYDANPEAFDRGSIDRIIVGAVLRVPDKSGALRRGIAEAKEFISGHRAARSTGAAPSKPKGETAPPSVAAKPPGDKALTLLAPEQAKSGSGKKSASAKGELAMEIADTVKQENENIRARLSGLEQQLQLMQRLLSLKDEQIAALQAGKPMPPIPSNLEAAPPPSEVATAKVPEQSEPSAAATAGAAAPTAEATQPAPVVPAPTAIVAEAAKPMETQSAAQTAEVLAAAKPPVSGEAPAVPGQPAPSTVSAQPASESTPAAAAQVTPPTAPVAAAPAAVPAAPAKPPAAPSKPAVKPAAPKEEPGFFSGLFADSYMAAILGGVGLSVVGLAVLAIKRRRAALADLDSDMPLEIRPINVSQPAATAGMTDAATANGLVSSSQHGSFLSDFTPSDFDVLDTDNEAIDPISEADVYLAYGRYAQAEELIRQAINENPFRDECKLKLLEVFYTARNRESFEKYAAELVEENKNSDQDFWARVVDMGHGLAPDNPMFGSGKAAASAASEPAPAPAPAVSPVAEAVPATSEPEPVAVDESDDLGFSFDLDGDVPVAQESEPAGETETPSFDATIVSAAAVMPPVASTQDEADAGLSFDLGGFDLQPEEPAAAPSEPAVSAASLSFEDLPLTGDEPAASSSEALEPAALSQQSSAASEIDFDLSSFGEEDFGSLTPGVAAPAAPQQDAQAEPAAEPSALDFDAPELEAGEFSFAAEPLAAKPEPAAASDQDGSPVNAERSLEFDVSSLSEGGFSFAGVEQPPVQETAPSQDEDAGLSFDLGSFESPANQPEPAAPAVEAADAGPSLEFDLTSVSEGGFSFAGVTQSAADEPVAVVEEDAGRSLEFDFSSTGAEIAQPAVPAAAEAEPEVELDLSEFADMAPATPRPTAAGKHDEFSFDMNFDMAGQSLDDIDLDMTADSVEVLTDMDEVETKLDLAKAYVDMENPDAAKLMLEEILQLGDERQKLEAGELLARLG